MTILVCGGAGYIGSHTVKELVGKYEVVVLDNLSTGFPFLLDKTTTFVNGDLGDERILDFIFSTYKIEAVFHFAANSLVGESEKKPLMYYSNNVCATVTLLKKMVEYGVGKFVFSSSAATYGIPKTDIIIEETATNPINTYGRSKLFMEQILVDVANAHDLKYVILRYFNAAGAHISNEIGESHDPESHLIPIVIQHLLGKRDEIHIFGTDYDTPDGTCIRDYIHVSDIANAHVLAYEGLISGVISNEIYNLGTGAGYSVKEIIEACEKISGNKAVVKFGTRRAGDPAVLVASSEKIKNSLRWKPKYKLTEIIESAWKWHSR